jgi:type III secretion protein R
MLNANPLNIITFLTLLSLVPIIVIMTTCFVKVSMVLLIARESLGVQSIPPNMVIYCLSLILTFYVMGPVYNSTINTTMDSLKNDNVSSASIISSVEQSSTSIAAFLYKNTPPANQDFFYKSLKQFWTPEMFAKVHKNDLVVLIPAFMIAEMTRAFRIGFLIYLPSVIIDVIVSNLLMAMGMMMMSPVTISLPIKLLLFISLDGWMRIVNALMGSYIK